MINTSLCCCDIGSTGETLRTIQIGDDSMKNFKYKNNIYVLNQDIMVNRTIEYYKENGEKVEYIIEPGNYKAEYKYRVLKGYHMIEEFKTEEEANAFVNEILKMVGEEDVSKSV